MNPFTFPERCSSNISFLSLAQNATEKLAAENRSLRGELERTLVCSKIRSPFTACWTQEPAHLDSIRGAASQSRKDGNGNDITAMGTTVENVLHTQVR